MKNRTTNHQSTFFLLIVIFVIGFIVRFIFSNFLKTIYVYGDELRYYGIARSFFNGTALSFRNAPTDFQKILYSLIISPSFSISNGIIRNIVIDAINCLLMCSSIFPTWLILKKMQIADNECWFTILIMLLWPDMLFSMTFMSENLYWPLSLWFIYLWIINEDSEKKIVIYTWRNIVLFRLYVQRNFLGYVSNYYINQPSLYWKNIICA